MNQAIQFPDVEEWDELTCKVQFPVLISGMLFECIISESLLYRRYGEEASPLTLFQRNRWDIEEEFEDLIAQDLTNERGYYSLPDDK